MRGTDPAHPSDEITAHIDRVPETDEPKFGRLLEDPLGDVQTDCGNLHDGSFSSLRSTARAWHIDAVRGRPPHQFCLLWWLGLTFTYNQPTHHWHGRRHPKSPAQFLATIARTPRKSGEYRRIRSRTYCAGAIIRANIRGIPKISVECGLAHTR